MEHVLADETLEIMHYGCDRLSDKYVGGIS